MKKKSLLLISGTQAEPPAETTIGTPGEMGFGVGCFTGGDEALAAMELTPLPGYSNPRSNNYGNYRHANGSIMVFVPAFAYRIGNAAAPRYADVGANALEIRDARQFSGFDAGSAFESADLGDGWVLHRAFVDNGVMQQGFFIDKYPASKDETEKIAVSVKGANPIALYTGASYNPSSTLTGCSGKLQDAIIAGAARGGYYACQSIFMRSALSMLAHAHGLAAADASACAWLDTTLTTNYPKGNNSGSLTDKDDNSVTFTRHSLGASFTVSLTGSGVPFAKTTHNGQPCGVADVNGCKWEVCIGINFNGGIVPLLPTVPLTGITVENINDVLLYEVAAGVVAMGSTKRWGSGVSSVFYPDSSGALWGCCGVYPAVGASSSASPSLFGHDFAVTPTKLGAVPVVGGGHNNGFDSGVWARHMDTSGWTDSMSAYNFRTAAYPPA